MKELSEIRELIDKTDDEIKNAFIKRLELMKDVAEAKKRTDKPLNDAKRENSIVFRLTENMSENYARYIKELYSVIFSASKAYQSELIGRSSATVDEIKSILSGGIRVMSRM